MLLHGYQYPLYWPRYISGYEKVKITTTKQTNTMETEPLTKRIVIFGATGDLCRRKLIPALYQLWCKHLLPKDLLIVGASRREHSKETWLNHLGDYPEDFTRFNSRRLGEFGNKILNGMRYMFGGHHVR